MIIHKSLKAKDVITKSIQQNMFSHRPLANVDESFPEVREFKAGEKKNWTSLKPFVLFSISVTVTVIGAELSYYSAALWDTEQSSVGGEEG